MRYLLLDRITELKPPESAKGLKAVALSEDYFADHFPRQPVMPGALIVESLAQLGGVLLDESVHHVYGRRLQSVLTVIERAKFRTMVQPGDRLDLEAKVLHLEAEGGRVEVVARLGERLAASAIMIFNFREPTADLEEARARQVAYWLDPRPAWQRRP